jgi:hypothetical protein
MVIFGPFLIIFIIFMMFGSCYDGAACRDAPGVAAQPTL